MSLEAQLRQGEVVAAKYRILRVLGPGGMGIVFGGNHIDLDRRVALRLMLRNADPQDDAMVRFQREARGTARRNSPQVAKVFDVDCLEQRSPYLAIELLKGSDLRALIKQRGTIPVQEAVDYLSERASPLLKRISTASCIGI